MSDTAFRVVALYRQADKWKPYTDDANLGRAST